MEKLLTVPNLMNLNEMAGVDGFSHEYLALHVGIFHISRWLTQFNSIFFHSTDDVYVGKYITEKPSSKTTLS